MWLGLLAVILASFLFKNTNDRLGLMLMSSFAVASGRFLDLKHYRINIKLGILGVWIVGCCGDRKCGFLYVLVGAFSSSLFTVRFLGK